MLMAQCAAVFCSHRDGAIVRFRAETVAILCIERKSVRGMKAAVWFMFRKV